MNREDSNQSIHINYDKKTMPYHQLIANLVVKYGASNDRVLDVGCGAGNMLEAIRRKSKEFLFYAADIDPICLEVTGGRVELQESIQIRDVADLFEYEDVQKEFYDVIVMSHVLEHVKRPYETVIGLMSLLKKGGHLILAVPNAVRPDVILLNLFRKYSRVNKGHLQTWDMAHWRNFLENALQLNVVEYPPDFMMIPKLNEVRAVHPLLVGLAKLFPGFSRSCIAVIKK